MARTFSSGNYLSHAAAVVAGPPLSQSIWFNTSSPSTAQDVCSVGISGAANSRHALRIQGSNIQAITASNGGVNGIAAAVVTITADTWHHGAGVWVGTAERHGYYDGGTKGSDTTDLATNTLDITTIGQRPNNLAPFLGRLAEYGIWNVALTDPEVAALARGVSPRLVRPESLVGYWPVWGAASPEPDLSGGVRNMSLTGTPAQADHAPVMPYFWSQPWVPTAAAAAAASYELTDYGFFLPDGVGV